MEVRVARRCRHGLANYPSIRGTGKRPSHLVSCGHQIKLVGGAGVERSEKGIGPNVVSRPKAIPVFITFDQCVVAALDLSDLLRCALRQSSNFGELAGEP